MSALYGHAGTCSWAPRVRTSIRVRCHERGCGWSFDADTIDEAREAADIHSSRQHPGRLVTDTACVKLPYDPAKWLRDPEIYHDEWGEHIHIDPPKPCFMCGEPTHRVDLDYQGPYCGRDDARIAADLDGDDC